MTRTRSLRRFIEARSGNVAVIFGFAALPILALGGAAIDYGFATRLEARLQASTDATALRLCQMDPVSATLSILQSSANSLMTGFMDGTVVIVDPLALVAKPRKIRVTTHATSKTYFGKFTGLVTPTVTATAQCATASEVPQDHEIALVIDTTGSMDSSAGTQSKIAAARDAAKEFITSVFTDPSFGAGTKMSLVPFAGSVAVPPATYRYASWIDTGGASKYHWTNIEKKGAGFNSRFDIFDTLAKIDSSWGWAGCVETLPYPQNVQDGYSTGKNKLYVPMFAPDEPDGSSGNSYIADFNTPKKGDNSNDCPNESVSGYEIDSEARACKYNYAYKSANVKPASGLKLANGPNYACTSQPLQTLTRSSADLTAQVSTLVSRGSTNIFEGLMWGWRTISPLSVFGQGAAYGSGVNKAIVLMTDGTNTWYRADGPNNSLFSSMGYVTNADGSSPLPRLPPAQQTLTDGESLRDALDALTNQGCANAKAAGVTIYTVAFSTPGEPIDPKGLSLLTSCASPGFAFVANDATALKAAYRKIFTLMGKLRLTQ